MTGTTYIPLPNELLVRLVERYQDRYAGVIEHIVEDFLERTEEEADLSAKNGMIWNQLRLPHGTELRTKYYGEWQVARIEDGKIVYNGKTYDSPSRACSAMRGRTSNNAWKLLEIKRPQDLEFRLADRFRQ